MKETFQKSLIHALDHFSTSKSVNLVKDCVDKYDESASSSDSDTTKPVSLVLGASIFRRLLLTMLEVFFM